MRTFLYWLVRLTLRPVLSPLVPLGFQRVWGAVAALSTQGPKDCASAPLMLERVPALRLTPATARPGRALLYLHCGAYVIGGPASHAKLAAQLGHAAGCEVFFPDYRLAPESPFPAALDDAIAAWQGLLARGWTAQQLAIAGDSAGGGLALATVLALRERQLPLPRALVLLSPWTDLTLSGESHASKAAADPMLKRSWLAFGAARYAGALPLDDPRLSPLFADLSGLPPMLIQVGSEEILLSDAERLAQRAGAGAKLSRYDGVWHDFQVHAGMLAESDRALAEIGEFLKA